MKNSCIVYGLFDRAGKICYVGQTIRPLSARLQSHQEKRGHISSWMKRTPGWSAAVLEPDAVLHDTEMRLIEWYRRHGATLINRSDGGEGNHGYRWTEEQLARISAIRKGRVITPEWRQAISAGSRGKPKPSGFAARVSAGKTGKAFSAEHRAAIAAAARRQPPVSPETRAKLSALRKGVKKSPAHAAILRANLDKIRDAAIRARWGE